MNFGNEKRVLGTDKMIDTNGIDHEEAPCNANIVMPAVVNPNVVIQSLIMKS
jgi:hypothetical protein